MPDTIKPLFSWRSAICESDLSPTTRHVALTLSLHMNERGGSAFPGPTLLARETGLHISTVKERLVELERAGWLRCVARGGRKGEAKHANEYVTCIPEPALFDAPVATDARYPSPPAPGAQDYPSPPPRAPVAVGDPNSPSNSPTKNIRAGVESDFEAWWAIYPRRVDKARAFAAYKARRRQGIPASQLHAAAEHYAQAKADTEPRFVKHGATFLAKDGAWSEWVNGPPEPERPSRGALGAVDAALRGDP